MNNEEVFDLPGGAKYRGPKLRFYRVCNMFDESDKPTESSYEFIGHRVATDCDDPVDEWGCHVTHRSLYQDIEGLLHYCYGYEVEVGSWDVHVLILYSYWCYGKNLEEIRAQYRDEWGPDVEIPSILESPPEVETMHEMTGYDS